MKIVIKSLSKRFGSLEVLRNIDLTIQEGEVTALLGPSGCGKTTLLNIISGTDPYYSGNIEWQGARRLSYLFQEPRLLPWKTVEDNLRFILPDDVKGGYKGDYRGEYKVDKADNREELIDHYLTLVGLLDFKNYYPGQLSGGMKQRVAIARAFLFPADIILMDEPFQALDLRIKLSLVNIFTTLWMQSGKTGGKTALFVTHDVQEALLLGDRIVGLSERPAVVRKQIRNPLPDEKRSLNNEEILRLERDLYTLVM